MTLISDYRLPITPESERLMVAFQVINPVTVMRTVNKAMENDPAAKKRIYNGHVIWEMVNEEAEDTDVEITGFDGGFGFDDDEEVQKEEEDEFIPNGAVTVVSRSSMVLRSFLTAV